MQFLQNTNGNLRDRIISARNRLANELDLSFGPESLLATSPLIQTLRTIRLIEQNPVQQPSKVIPVQGVTYNIDMGKHKNLQKDVADIQALTKNKLQQTPNEIESLDVGFIPPNATHEYGLALSEELSDSIDVPDDLEIN